MTLPHHVRPTRLAVVALVALSAAAVGWAAWPRTTHCRESNVRARCASNLHQIGLAILLYQQAHGGQCPDTPGQLVRTTEIGPAAFVCPATDDRPSAGPTLRAVADAVDAGPAGHRCSYVYLARGLTAASITPTTVLAYEPVTNHDRDGGNVLFGDGHVEWQIRPDPGRLIPAATRSVGGAP